MLARLRAKRGQRGAILMLFTIMLPFLLLPLVGLGIDATVIHIVQAKLSAAVDGAALGAGRLLGTRANTSEIAKEFFNANFVTGTAGFWGATLPADPTITVVLGTTKTITVSATANVPTLFMRIVGFKTATVSASAVATKRDSRMILIIDRSGSMDVTDHAGSTVIEDVKDYARSFTESFTNGADELGLVVFDGSSVVGYPTNFPWNASATGTGGPDKSFYDGSSDDMPHQIANINAVNGTGMADALSVAYIEIQKAHMRDLLADGVDDRLNSIVLFTDGVPSAISLYLNDPAGTSVKSSGSGCTYVTDNGTHPMKSWVVLSSNGGKPPYTAASGVYQLATLDSDPSHTPVWWMSHAGRDNVAATNPDSYDGCSSGGNGWTSLSNLKEIPDTDLYGNSTTTNGYIYSHFVDDDGDTVTPNPVYNGTALDRTKYSGNYPGHGSYSSAAPYHWGLAAWNAVDNAAKNIRLDTNYPNRTSDTARMAITIYAIGYYGNGGLDDGLLKRVANDVAADGYTTAQPTGIYVPANNPDQLEAAFNTIASAILRLAK